MTRNIGMRDRDMRSIVALLLLAYVYILPTAWDWLGLISIATAA
jgi:hypothetical protein